MKLPPTQLRAWLESEQAPGGGQFYTSFSVANGSVKLESFQPSFLVEVKYEDRPIGIGFGASVLEACSPM